MLGTTIRRTTMAALGGFQGFASAAALADAPLAPVCSSSPCAPAPVVERAPQQCRSNAPSFRPYAPFVERYSFAFTHVRESSSSSTVDAYKVGESTNIKWHEGSVSREAREQSMGQKGCVLWFTGLSGSGKSTVAYTLEHALHGMGKKVYVMDGDNIRHGLNSNLGFSAVDREENIRRIGEVAKLFADMGVITLVSFISPYRNDRDLARSRMARDTDFVEVFMKIPIEICETRDPKGLYKAARAGKLKGFTGIDDPYEEPLNAEIVVEAKKEASDELEAPEAMASTILDYLSTKGYLSP
ncbi:adenylyl-sulfate kinase [Pycnococcus provasolii]